MEQERTVRYEVRDVGLAAYFLIKRFKMVSYFVDSRRRVIFVFEGAPNKIKEAEEEYRLSKEESKVPARQFYEAYMNIRSLAISIARQVEEEDAKAKRDAVFS